MKDTVPTEISESKKTESLVAIWTGRIRAPLNPTTAKEKSISSVLSQTSSFRLFRSLPLERTLCKT
jgi:hypothetical protein